MKKKSTILLAILLAIIIVSSFFASCIQSNGFSVDMIELKDVSNSGFVYDAGVPTAVPVEGSVTSGMLFVPANASATNPVPGVCLTHGYLNTWQLQLQNAIELARRGFAVLVIEQQGHGDNNNAINWPGGMQPWSETDGLYSAVKYLYNQDFVDKTKIGVSGHSMGGEATDVTVILDGEKYLDFCAVAPGISPEGKGLGIITAAIMQGFDPVEAMTPGGLIDETLWDEDVSVGILKGSDDEFFFANTFADGSSSRCRDYLQSVHAAKFTKSTYTEGDKASINIVNGGVYVDGAVVEVTEGTAVGSPFRAIYQNDGQIHPQNHFSTKGAQSMINFFYNAFGTPSGGKYIASNNQVWWLKEALSAISLICFFLLLIPGSALLLEIPFFADLKAKVVPGGKNESPDIGDYALKPLKGIRKHLTLWITAVACAIFAGAGFVPLYNLGSKYFPLNATYPQDTTNPVVFWAACVGLFTLAAILVGYIINYAINKAKYKDAFKAYDDNPFRNVVIPTGLAGFLKTLVLAVLSVVLLYGLVFLVWAIFKVDFRLWSFNVKTFNVWLLLPVMLRYMPLFAIFYCINAFANSTYRAKNLPEWVTIAINAVMNTIGVGIMIWFYYSKLMATGVSPTMMLPIIVVFPLVLLLPLITIQSRVLYNRTGNIWYGAFVNTMLVTIITVANTAASYAYAIV